MSKRLLSIILFLSLSLFLVMPVYAADEFTKTTGVEIESLDYRNSLIDWSGFNIEIDIIWDKRGGASPTSAFAALYVDFSLSFILTTWEYNAEEDIYYLLMSSSQQQQIKSVLFGRYYSDNTFLMLGADQQMPYYFFEVRIRFKSLLNINFKSMYIADRLGGNNEQYTNEIYKVVSLESDNLLVAGILIDNTNTQGWNVTQKAQYNFVNKYTNIEQIYLSYVHSKETSPIDVYTAAFIHQIGIFADSQVILPDLDIDTDFQIYEPTICGAFDLGCVSRNLIGEFSNNIYKRLGAENIASGIMNIYDTIFYPVYIIDDASWQNGIISIYAIIGIGVLYLIVKRVLG